jgi:hypothetical protein
VSLYSKLGVRWYHQSLNNAIGQRELPGLVHAVVGGFTPGKTSFLVMNPDFHFVLAMDVNVCTAGVGTFYRPVCVRV